MDTDTGLEVVAAHAPLIAGIVRGLRPELSQADVMDAVHDVALRVLRRVGELNDPALARAYIASATRNHVFSQLRHASVERRVLPTLCNPEDEIVEGVDRETWPGDRANLTRWLAGASEQDQELFKMMFDEGLGRPAVARRKGWTEHHARTAIASFLARSRLAILQLRRGSAVWAG